MVEKEHLMAFHSLEEIQELVRADAWNFGTRRSREKAREYGFTRQQVADCLLTLTTAHFRKEFGNVDTDYGTLQADDYVIEYDDLWLHIKFAIFKDEAHGMCVIASFHT